MDWYEAEVQDLERAQDRRLPGMRPPVFYGSSSIRLWTTLSEDFDPRVVNLGFGGSTLQACDYFFSRLIPPVNPRSILLYAGDNDLGDGRDPESILGSFRSLADQVERSLGAIPLGFVSVKPSPARYSIIERIRQVNALILQEIKLRPSAYYVDVFGAMLNEAGKPNGLYFLADGLHLSHEGYRLWSRLLKPYRNRIFTD